MRHFFPLLLLPLVAVAAPVPKEKPKAKMERLFGTIADAKKGYDFSLDGEKLVLTMDANASDSLNEKAPPQVGREVTGDFEAQVTVSFPIRNGKEEGSRGTVVAGLCVWAADGRYHFVGPAARRGADGWELKAGMSWDYMPDFKKNNWTGTLGHPHADSEVTQLAVRVKRDKNGLQWFQSTDGKSWEEWKTYLIALPDTACVGVCGMNTTDAAWSVTSSDFAVVPLKSDKK